MIQWPGSTNQNYKMQTLLQSLKVIFIFENNFTYKTKLHVPKQMYISGNKLTRSKTTNLQVAKNFYKFQNLPETEGPYSGERRSDNVSGLFE